MPAFGTLFPLEVSSWNANIMYKTDVTVGANGQESRNALWQDPLKSFNAAFLVKTYADIATLATFFHAVKGREQSFLVKDPQDYKVSDWTVFAETPNGVITAFQLIKKYTHAVIGTYTRTITKPKALEGAGGVTIRDNGVEMATTAYSFSSVTGIVTIPIAPLTGRVIDFKIDEFYVPVRFDIDELPIDLLYWWIDNGADGGIVEVPDIRLKEVRGE